jgi:type I restriction enzyme, S subunit
MFEHTQLPQNWKCQSIIQIGRYHKATVQTGPFGAQLHSEDYVDEGTPFILIRNIRESGVDPMGMPCITPEDAQRLSTYALEPGDVVFSRVGRVGSCFLVEEHQAGWVISGQLLRIRLPAEEIQGRYLIHALRSKPAQDAITGASVGTTRTSINTHILESLVIPVPPLAEQRRIAEVLDTADAAIQATDSLIAKLKQMKAGLLHDLLTRGLDADGNLRDPIAHPEQFKETALGRVPREWEVVSLSEVVPRAEYGISVSLEDATGIPVLRMNNLSEGEAVIENLKYSGRSEARSLLLEPLDVLFNRTNSIDHVGRTGIWRGQLEEASFASYLVRLVPDHTRLNAEFLNIWLNLPPTQIAMRRYATPGVHQVNINPTNLRRLTMALPSVAEQITIVSHVDAHNFRLRLEETYLTKLRDLKKGLMADLLTGRVRVDALKEAMP